MRFVTVLVCALLALPVGAVELNDYLPDGVTYDPSVPKPAELLGFEVGEWHVRHDQLLAYMQTLADASPRVRLEVTGRTHEGRKLVLLAISTAENIGRLDDLRARHLAESDSGEAADGPLVVWQGFSVHGNEPSGANSSMLLAYHLAAGSGAVDELLADTIVLIDPAVNPDGLGRFAQWANSHRSRTPVADRANREHNEVWPNGRTNHYWFDLNRDWLLLTHPESRARIEQFHRWRPHVLTDFHEMGSNSTYYFQPGVPERRNPWTPLRNEELTRGIAGYHARAMDRAGQLYYSEETFDDFYYGKGSTYPDVNGSIGILFEQASSRGHLMETIHGELSFADTVANQFRMALSTLEGADELRDELRDYHASFWTDAREEGRADPGAAIVLGDRGDPARARALLDILLRHRIEVHALAREVEIDGRTYRPGAAWVVPLGQRQYRLVQAMMEYRTTFEDNTFYDVSAWTMPSAFNLPHAELGKAFKPELLGDRLTEVPPLVGGFSPRADAVSYAFQWTGYYAPRALQRLFAGEFAAYAATQPMTVESPSGPVDLGRGSILIPLGLQKRKRPAGPGTSAAAEPPEDRRTELEELLGLIAERDGLQVVTILGGMTPKGVDLGSPTVRRLTPVRPLIVVGDGVRGYDAGEVWHLLDTRVDLPLTMVESSRFTRTDLNDYTHVVLVDGSYKSRSKEWTPKLQAWVRSGGVLVANRRAAEWVTKQGLHLAEDPENGGDGRSGEERVGARDAINGRPLAVEDDDEEEEEDAPEETEETRYRPYGEFRADRALRVIGGAIFVIELDNTHPLGYGFVDTDVPVFRSGTLRMEPSENPYETVARYPADPLLSGYASEERQEQIAGSAAIVASRVGRGAVVRMMDNPNFRGVWYGTNKLFLNTLFFGRLIDATKVDD